MKQIGVVTTSRAEYGIVHSVLRHIMDDPDLRLLLFIGGQHLSPEFGLSVREIERDGFEIAKRIEVESLLSGDTPSAIATSIGLTTIGFSQAFARTRPDVLLVTADRFEMFAAMAAAVPFNIPLAHLMGGDVTEGAIDEQFRHAMTKMAHLHFTATKLAYQRVLQMGEENWRVILSGNPAIDSIPAFENKPFQNYLLVVYHPVTLEADEASYQIDELLAALSASCWPITFILGGSDTNGHVIHRKIKEFAANYISGSFKVRTNVGPQDYYRLMYNAAAIVGNSSSALLEAPTLRVPAVNIGNRQAGRLRAANVIDVGYTRAEILEGITRATTSEFRAGLAELENPYGDGHAAERIVKALKDTPLDRRLLIKRFVLQ